MNEEQNQSDPLGDLLGDLVDQKLDAAGWDSLAELLRNDAAARARYVEHLQLHGLLGYELQWRDAAAPQAGPSLQSPMAPSATQPVVPNTQESLSRFSLQRPVMRYALAASLILCVGVIASVFNLMHIRAASDRDLRTALATLTETDNAVFGDSEVPTEAGSQLSGGFLRLKSGTAKIAFYSGAEVTLHGPCEFGVNSEMRGHLQRGKITAYVPEKAHGFTIGAKGVVVVDLGTRFTMSVDDGGASAVRVVEGSVELRSADGTQTMTVNQVATIDAQGAVVSVSGGVPIDVSNLPVGDALTSGKLPPNVEIAGSHFELTDRGIRFNGGVGGRTYLRTVRTDWYLTGFVAEVTVDVPDSVDPWAITFFGLGTGDLIDTTAYAEPIAGAHVLITLRNDAGVVDSRLNKGLASSVVQARNVPIRNGTHRVRMIWDAEAHKATYEVEAGNKGKVTTRFELDASDVIFSTTNCHMLFGGAAGLTFRDFSVKPAEAK